MELCFATIRRGDELVETLRVKSKEKTNYSGHTTVETQSQTTQITDTFDVIKKTGGKVDEEGWFYDWYEITNHYRTENRFNKAREEDLRKQRSDIDFVAMMANIDLEED